MDETTNSNDSTAAPAAAPKKKQSRRKTTAVTVPSTDGTARRQAPRVRADRAVVGDVTAYDRLDRQVGDVTMYKLEEIARLRAMGMTYEEVAAKLECALSGILRLARTQAYSTVSQRVRERLFAGVDGALAQQRTMEILEDNSGEAAQALVRILQESDDDVERRMAATAILDRAGYGPVQRRAVRQRIELDPVMARIFGEALKESALVKLDDEDPN